ncbi:hypothetical protein Pflav_038540 [Phytohabitans flavus]|uniref:Uncharacterized protein n=1 Tax=Phytohabitans flavus TaxID=1076124 RepID=A0A6F8XUC8_9ACTN|nr:hypothetical protein Pflav_038540 [Phytohabitans flavus]
MSEVTWEISSREPTITVPLVTTSTTPTMTASFAHNGSFRRFRMASDMVVGSDQGGVLRQRSYVRSLKDR